MLPTPLPMKKVKLYLMDADAQQAALTLARLAVLHPLEEKTTESDLPDFPARPYHDVYHRLKGRFDKIVPYVREHLRAPKDADQIVTLQQLTEIDEQLKTLWLQVSSIEEDLRRAKENQNTTRQLSNSLHRFEMLDLDLSRLKGDSRFLKFIVGSVPSSNLSQLKNALSLMNFLLFPFHSEAGLYHVVITGPSEQQTDVAELLKSADFRELSIPEEFSASPARLKQNLDRESVRVEQILHNLQHNLQQLLKQHRDLIVAASELLVWARPYASLVEVMRGQGGLVSLQGWVPVESEQRLKQQLQQDLSFAFHVEYSKPKSEELDSVPSLLRHSWLLRPFQSLVSNFGIPGYSEIDPTGLFMFSYILMFGMMFGDIGHGAVIFVFGLLLWRRYPAVTIVACLAGLSSVVFGFVYGSLFGYEHLIEPLWMSPMHDPEQVLLVAVVWGAGFLIIASLLSIRNLAVEGSIDQALYSDRGVAGLLFYLSILFAAYEFMANQQFGWLEGLLLALPMLTMLAFQWRHTQGDYAERALVVFIEGLEHVISNVSGTLSFLRVAAFSLNHIALAAAVFSIAAMLDSVGHWITIVLGNLFIIVLEGAIVAIQVLRLEYYEGFSRFFSGKGKC